MVFRTLLLRAIVIAFGCLQAQFAAAADVEIRFIAADRENKPPVSELVDFRRSPDGGLIATQWLSGVRLEDAEIFSIVDPTAVKAKDPQGDLELEERAQRDR